MKRGFARVIGLLATLLLVVALVAMLFPCAVMASNTGEVVDLVLPPPNQTVNIDDTFTVIIEAQCNGQDVTGISAFLDFNPDYLEVQSLTSGSTLGIVLQNTYDNSAGTIDYSAGKLTAPLPSGTFTLVAIQFKATAAVASTSLSFHTTGNRVSDADYGGASKLNNTTGATVTISSVSTGGSATSPPSGPPPEPGTTDVSSIITGEGAFTEVALAQTQDGACKLIIDKGTIALTGEEEPLSEISMTELEESPAAPPQDAYAIEPIYNLGPDGAIFEPAIIITIAYDPAEIPEGIAEEGLVIAWWDTEASEWVELLSNVNPDTNIITASVEHFTAFTILGYKTVMEPASFSVSLLNILPGEAGIGGEVTISLVITNTGVKSGSYKVTLKINDMVEASKHVTVNAGSSEKVSFTTSRDTAGNYSVDVNGLTGSFKISGGAAPSPAPLPAPQAKPVNWPVLWGVIAGTLGFGLLILVLARRRPY